MLISFSFMARKQVVEYILKQELVLIPGWVNLKMFTILQSFEAKIYLFFVTVMSCQQILLIFCEMSEHAEMTWLYDNIYLQ